MNVDQLIQKLLASIADENLAVLAGAGLSMSPPTQAPGAAVVANRAILKHQALTNEKLPPEMDWDLEKVAQHFYAEGKLSTYFANRLVDWTPFRTTPNRGHVAIADLLACGAFDLAITTNYDELVESAARTIGEADFRCALDGAEANQAKVHRPYLKIYGCCVRDVQNTVWCVEQTTSDPLATRLERSKDFLSGRLLNRDLLVIGFWSDWQYLNSILESALPPASNGHIYLVDPQSDENLKTKAPQLWAWADKHEHFVHVEAAGDEVLDALRREFSRLLLRRVMLRSGADTSLEWLDGLGTEDVFAIRRDLAGVDGVARDRNDDASMSAFARAHRDIQTRGGMFERRRYTFSERRLRVIQAAGLLVSDVRADFAKTPGLSEDLDAVVCAGARDDGGVPASVVREESAATIIRGGTATLEFVTSVTELIDGKEP